MVMYTVNDSGGNFNLADVPPVTKVLTQTATSGETDYLFTTTNKYNATMFAVQGADGDWLGALFYGNTTVGPDGKVGIIPYAQVEGSVSGVSVDAFAVDYVTAHGSNDGLTKALFAGDDTLIGSKWGQSLSGEAGNDLIVATVANNPITLDGGAGKDVIHATNTGAGYTAYAIGGGGADFIFMSDGYVTAKGGAGADTFFYSQGTGKAGGDTVQDFDRKDHFQLDPAGFAALAGGVSKENFYVGPSAFDSTDFLIFDAQGHLYYDPDGIGGQDQIFLATLSPDAPLTWQSFIVSDAVPKAGDHSAAPPAALHEAHAWALHAGIHATGVLP